jgi:hypothetical protein
VFVHTRAPGAGQAYGVDTCRSTWGEVEVLAGVLSAMSADAETDVGLVSSPWHMRRIKVMVGKCIGLRACRFHFLPVPAERDPLVGERMRRWWKEEHTRRIVLWEMEKLVYFVALGRKGWEEASHR